MTMQWVPARAPQDMEVGRETPDCGRGRDTQGP